MSNNPEQLPNRQESGVEAPQPKIENIEKTNEKPEASVELSPRDLEAQAEQLKAEAIETARNAENNNKDDKKHEKNSIPSRRSSISKKQHDESYSRTMSRVQNELSTGSRIFSKFVHNKIIDSTSNFVGNTIARPNAILAGAVVGFILTLLVYTIAKTTGYALSGFETIASFIVGWIIGIVFDYLRVLVTGTKN